ncbi:MAG: glycosyltransferase family 39 protein [Candidatus Aenigmatarchaeota archaeon]
MSASHSRREKILALLIGIFIVAVAIRGIYFAKQWSVWWDETVYLSMADAFAGNNYFIEYFRPPLLPFMLYLFGTIAGISVASGKLFSILLSMATVAVAYLLVRKILDKEKALIVAFLFAINFHSIFYSTRILAETPAIFFSLLSLGFLYLACEKKSDKYAMLSGIFIGLGMMAKHAMGFFAPLVIIYLFLTTRFKFLRDRRTYIIGLLTLAVLSPWLVFNWLQFGNPLWAQILNYKVTEESTHFATYQLQDTLFYLINFPEFVGITGIFLLFTLGIKKIKKDRFLMLNWLTIAVGVSALSLLSHKEARFMIMFLPSIIILEAIGIHNFISMLDAKSRKGALALILFALAIFSFLTFIEKPGDSESLIYKCNDAIAKLPNEIMSTTMQPYFSFINKRYFEQLPWDYNNFTCDEISWKGYNYSIYYSAGWYHTIEPYFISATANCTELIENITEVSPYGRSLDQKCLIFRIKR